MLGLDKYRFKAYNPAHLEFNIQYKLIRSEILLVPSDILKFDNHLMQKKLFINVICNIAPLNQILKSLLVSSGLNLQMSANLNFSCTLE